MIETRELTYQIDGISFHGFYAFDNTISHKRPGILIAHDWTGLTDFTRNKAKKLAELGYVGFALDMYGEGKTGASKEEKMQLMQPLVNDRHLLFNRMQGAMNALQNLDIVNSSALGVIGFCFGGLCALDLARSSSEIKGVVSFHGGLTSPPSAKLQHIMSKILVLHGYEDPLVPKEQIPAFEAEMTEKNADWQIHIYGNAMHSFTNPDANDKSFGTVYNALADKRSWLAMKNFFNEVF